MTAETLLQNGAKINFSFSQMRSTQKEEDADDAYPEFSIGSNSASKAVTRPTPTTEKKTALFSSQITASNHLPLSIRTSTPYQMTVEQEKASSAARCLAILGFPNPSDAADSALAPTQEEIQESRRRREEEIMKKYEAIKEMEERKKNLRPLVWAKPTFCPFGGETKSDDEESSSEAEGEKNKKKRKAASSDDEEDEDDSISRSKVMDSCSNLLCKDSDSIRRRNRHKNLFPNYLLPGPTTVSLRTDWSKEEVDRFVESTKKWTLPERKKAKRSHHFGGAAAESAFHGLSEF